MPRGPSSKHSDGEKRLLVREANMGPKIIVEVAGDINSSKL